jgi:hypothetical protein
MWQVTRDRNMYQLGYGYQDYSKNEIVLIKESFNPYQFKKELDDKGFVEKYEELSYHEQDKLVLQEIKNLDGVTLIKKFTLKEL